MRLSSLFLFGLILLLLTGCNQEVEITPVNTDYAEYTSIVNKGSDTLVNLALAWAEMFHQLHPTVEISITGGGTGTGIAALINGTVDIANASRQIKNEELQLAEDNGGSPVEFVVAKDAIAII